MCEIFNCTLDYLMCKTDIETALPLDENTVFFINNIKKLSTENQKIARNLVEGLLAIQDKEKIKGD